MMAFFCLASASLPSCKWRKHQVTDANLKPRSHALIDGANRAGARAMLRACGFKDDDFQRPLIGVANTWIEIGPCNYHLRELAEHVKIGRASCRERGEFGGGGGAV